MKKLSILILFVSLFASGLGQNNQTKKVAVLPTVDVEGSFGRGEILMIGNRLAAVLRRFAGYQVYERVNISAIMDEQKFQRSGLVSDNQIKKIGEVSGVDLVLYTEVSRFSNNKIFIQGKLINVETAEWDLYGDETAESIDDIEEALRKMFRRMLGVESGQTVNQSNNSRGPSFNRDFVETAAGLNMKMVWVEGGVFLRGGTSEQGSDVGNDEKIIRHVGLDSYYIGECEITQEQWTKVMGTSIQQQASKSIAKSCRGVGPDYPMYYVNWEEAQAFCQELSRMTGRTYRLPTEAQWEYAARGGKNKDGSKYSGSWFVDAVAWYGGNSGSSTHPVKNKRPNSLGLYDMSGNVWEWCSDWYDYSYNVNDTNNPAGPSSGSFRVLRGGSWFSGERYCRVSCRGSNIPGNRSNDIGFRVVVIP